MGPDRWQRHLQADGDVKRHPGPLWLASLNANAADNCFTALHQAPEEGYDALALQEVRLTPAQCRAWTQEARHLGHRTYAVDSRVVEDSLGGRASISSASMLPPPKRTKTIANPDIPGFSSGPDVDEDDVIPQVGHQPDDFESELEKIMD